MPANSLFAELPSGIGTPSAGPTPNSVPPPDLRFKVYHQKVSLDVDLMNYTLSGYTEITVVPTDNKLRQVCFDCRQMEIHNVLINKRKASFHFDDPLKHDDLFPGLTYSPMVPESNAAQHELYREKLSHLFRGGGSGELRVDLPDSMRLHPVDISSLTEKFSFASTNSPLPETVGRSFNTPGTIHDKKVSQIYTAFVVRIEYTVRNPTLGFCFYGGYKTLKPSVGPPMSKNLWHAYTSNQVMGLSTSSWVPCVDNMQERCTWQFEVVIPKTIGDIGHPRLIGTDWSWMEAELGKTEDSGDADGNSAGLLDAAAGTADVSNGSSGFSEPEQDDAEADLTVVCADPNFKEISHSMDPSKKVISFGIYTPVLAHHVGFAVGPFQQMPLPDLRPKPADSETADEGPVVPAHVYCLPHHAALAHNTCLPLYQALDLFGSEIGLYPFAAFGVCFVEELPAQTCSSAGLAMCSAKLLYGPELVEPLFAGTETLVEALAQQWAGIYVIPKTVADLWLTVGMAGYMTNMMLQQLMGNNEHRYRMKRAAERICSEDIGKPALYYQRWNFPIADRDPEMAFVRLKAPMVLFILDMRMTKTDRSFGLLRVLPKVFIQAMSGDLDNSGLGTAHFMRLCEKVAHAKMDRFFHQWVYRPGYPVFRITQRFNKKRMFIEMGIRQVQLAEMPPAVPRYETFVSDARHADVLAAEAEEAEAETGESELEPDNGVPAVFVGPMTIRIHEADGTPYEHIVDIKEGFTKLDIQYNTKYKKLRKNQRQKEKVDMALSDKAAQVQAGGTDTSGAAGADLGVLLHCLGDVLQTDQEMAEWGLAEWGKDEEDRMMNEAFEWLRVDADFEWICRVFINQPDYMFASQLQQDRDVVAQYEAVRYFADLRPQALYSTILVRTLMDSRYFYGIRVEAAMALARFAKEEADWIGMRHLMKAFQTLFCFRNSSIPLPNDFSDFRLLFVQKAIPLALSTVRDSNGRCPETVQRFLLDLLRYNENSTNEFDDCFYVGNLIVALVNSQLTAEKPSWEEFLASGGFELAEDGTTRSEPLGDSSSSAGSGGPGGLTPPSSPGPKPSLRAAAVEEIKKVQRMDKLLPSYQNVLSFICLRERLRLARHGIAPVALGELVQYTVPQYSVDVRVLAFEGLFSLGRFAESELLHYAFTSAMVDPSPSMKTKLILYVMRAIGLLALAELPEAYDLRAASEGSASGAASGAAGDGMLVVEENATGTMSARKDAFARSTVAGAVRMFRSEFGDNEYVKKELWKATLSPCFSPVDKRDLLDILAVLVEPHAALPVVLPAMDNKKVVAKREGATGVVIKRQGRFKIQLSQLKLSASGGDKKKIGGARPDPLPITVAVPKTVKVKVAQVAQEAKPVRATRAAKASKTVAFAEGEGESLHVVVSLKKKAVYVSPEQMPQHDDDYATFLAIHAGVLPKKRLRLSTRVAAEPESLLEPEAEAEVPAPQSRRGKAGGAGSRRGKSSKEEKEVRTTPKKVKLKLKF